MYEQEAEIAAEKLICAGREFDQLFAKMVESIGQQIINDSKDEEPKELVVIGIRTCGEYLAKRIAHFLQHRFLKPVHVGILDITLYRDDIYMPSTALPQLKATHIPIDIDIDSAYVILVDDVLFTGRTIRSALQALLDFGRPRVIRLAVMVDRNCRELPIQADVTALSLGSYKTDRIEVQMLEGGFKEDRIIQLH